MRSLIAEKERLAFLLIEFVISTTTVEIGRMNPRKDARRMSAKKTMEDVTTSVLTHLEDSSVTAGEVSNSQETVLV